MSKERPSASRHMIGRARKLRKDSTGPERTLWRLLRGEQFHGLKFRRQHPIGRYIADFYCHDSQLVIELDGASHDGRGVEDREREEWFRSQGLTVLRVGNDDVLKDIESVAMGILRAVRRL